MRRLALRLAALAMVGALLPGSAHAATAQQVIAALNAQRAANGIPAGIVENPEWSHRCELHIKWELRHNQFGHHEDPNTPDYTWQGEWAGSNSVLGASSNWTTPANNPFNDAPFHLIQVLNPSLSELGNYEAHDNDCTTTWPGFKRPHPDHDVAYTYPGDGARIPWFERAAEYPYAPGRLVGVTGSTTGPYLILYWDGQPDAPLTDVKSAKLVDAHGQRVDTATIDDRSEDGTPEDGLMAAGTGFLLPKAPLHPDSAYTGTVTWSAPQAGRTFTKSWTFRTTKLQAGDAAIQLRTSRSGKNLNITAFPLDRAYAGAPGTLRVKDTGRYTYAPYDAPVGSAVGPYAVPAKGQKLVIRFRVHAFTVGSTHVKGFVVTKTVNG